MTSLVHETRVALTVDDFAAAVAFYRDVLGLPMVKAWDEAPGSGMVLDAGRATLELICADQADFIDRVEVGRRVAGPVRLALQVDDVEAVARQLVGGGARFLGDPVITAWRHRNARVEAPGGMQLSLFEVLDPDGN